MHTVLKVCERFRIIKDGAPIKGESGRVRSFETTEGAQAVCDALIREHDPEEGDRYFLTATGRTFRRDLAEDLISRGELKPLADALFPDTDSQSWVPT